MARIRTALLSDVSSMIEVRKTAILAKARNVYGFDGAKEWAADGAATRWSQYAEQIADPNFVTLVAEGTDGIVGFAIANPLKRELSALYVKPNRIGLVGHALLAKIETQAFEVADFLTAVAGLNAVSFYEANGYTGDAIVPWTTRSGTSALCKLLKKARPAHGNFGAGLSRL